MTHVNRIAEFLEPPKVAKAVQPKPRPYLMPREPWWRTLACGVLAALTLLAAAWCLGCGIAGAVWVVCWSAM